MAEILTESFCERCGTRYTFESPARRSNPLGALGTVSRGLRNFVASPDQSIDEAFAVARAENEQKATAHQLEAFHRTFNFCLSCRQYTCGECWNPVEGRCQSCAPMPEAERLPGAALGDDSPILAEAMAIARAATTPVVDEAPPAAEAVAAPDLETGWEAEPVESAELFASLSIEDLAVDTGTVIEPGSIADEVEAEDVPEDVAEPADVAEPEAAAEAEAPEPAAAAEAEAPEAAAVTETEAPEAPEPEPEPWPQADRAPAGRRRPSSLPAFAPGASLDEEIAAYDLRVAAISGPASAGDALAPAAVHPATSEPTVQPVLPPIYVPGPVPDLPDVSPAALPAAQTTGACASCGLALSATARFCRRCGTPQHID
jgi:hypothetical protein